MPLNESFNPFKYNHFLIFYLPWAFPTLHDTFKNKRERLVKACFVLPVNLSLSNIRIWKYNSHMRILLYVTDAHLLTSMYIVTYYICAI